MANSIKCVRCHYCDQLHPVTATDLIERLGRPYYMVTCPVGLIGGEKPTTIVSADNLVTVR